MLDSKKLIAFDLDGTLVDSVPDIAAAANKSMQALGLAQVSESQVRGFVGNGVPTMLTRVLSQVQQRPPSAAQLQQAIALFNDFYQRDLCSHGALYPGVERTLAALKAKAITLVVITNKPEAFVPGILQHFAIEHYFDAIIGGDSLAENKPSPLQLNHVMTHFNAVQDDFLMVGDSKNDVLAAHAAKCDSIGLTYGYNYGEDISLSKPTIVANQFSDILQYLP
ncbi:phosphoglycolate phosphatase [Paraferrimonas haliotis]|uniref:Phosphoglycolate phosphatase n=1 Tax=Paraferrimonas haliotis TaxID=2013866 RepID=A0AA37TUU6_9GAMM|nr:phosphoglycolate phosphatase [Paraferrimonas haliotis]GLS82181.1 phosphoglycolate phosphatase [Paraferrimonas haliotis]